MQTDISEKGQEIGFPKSSKENRSTPAQVEHFVGWREKNIKS